MEVVEVLHMNGGIGETSYACNSSLQGKVISMTKPITAEAIFNLCSTTTLPKSLGIADLGCASGPNTLSVVSDLINLIRTKYGETGCPSPEFKVFLNDLPGNDFNTIFRSLPDLYKKLRQDDPGKDSGPCFIFGVPGSFYGRLFPSQSLHFVHSSYSLHYLSRVPEGVEGNKRNIYMAKTSPPSVFKAYLEQFERDFSVFLKSRSEEMVPGGRMILTLLGRRSQDPSSKECCYMWELLAQALNSMVYEGLIEEEKVDTFNLPLYTPSPSEIKTVIGREGSFNIDRLETFEVHWNPEDKPGNNEVDKLRGANIVARYMRAAAEPLLVDHFGEALMEQVFWRIREILANRMSKEETKHTNAIVSVTRRK
nr:salicylic acid methyltransferase [Nelumbo sp. SAMT]